MSKKILVPLITIFLSISCHMSSCTNNDDDRLAIESNFQYFIEWYLKQIETIDFAGIIQLDDEQHYSLDEDKLEAYLALLLSSGYAHEDLIQNEREFYDNCTNMWENVDADEFYEYPPGMSVYDRISCSNDGISELQGGEVIAEIDGNQAIVTYSIQSDGDFVHIIKFEMKKNNNNWLISRFFCDCTE